MRVLVYGNAPWCPSGYGTQAALLARGLRHLGHETAIAAFHGLQGTPLQWEGITVYPGSTEDPFAQDVLPAHYRHFQADLLITVMDAWVLDPAKLAGMNVAHWMPVDCEPLSAMDRRVLDGAKGRPVAMSEFGRRQLQDAGYQPLYAPHMLDMQNVWKPMANRDEAREQLGFAGLFVIGINAANQDPYRKGLGEQLDAFAAFCARHDDARLLIHSRGETRQGTDITEQIAGLGIGHRAWLGDQYQIAAGLVPEGQMVQWHAVLDLLSNCSWGEGFGLAVLQSQATGTPVVVTDCSSMRELCGAGWKVKGQRVRNRGHQAYWRVPSVPEIVRAYEKAYQHAGSLRDKARKFALRYDAERVLAGHWKPVLAELDPSRPELARKAAVPREKVRTVWSPVMFRDELDMLEMRLAETGGLIDRHLIVESRLTHRGVPKPLRAAAVTRHAGQAGQVTAVTAVLDPQAEPWANEHAQRDAAWPLIDAEASGDDVVLICDADEIPSRDLLERAGAGELPEVCSVRMRTTLHAVDWEVPQDRIPPTCVIATAGYIRKHGGSLAAIRDRRDLYQVIGDGGWHFSWTGGPAAAREKLETATCHTELLGTPEGRKIASGERYRTGEDGGGLPVEPADVDETWPAWIREHRCPDSWFRPKDLADTTLVITAFRRPDYLQQVLASWVAADRVRELRRIVIALAPSDREAEQRDDIAKAAAKLGRDIGIRMDSPECAKVWGPHRAIAEAGNAVLADDPGCRFLIFSEEDIQVSDDVLSFLLWGRQQAAGRAVAVCAHNARGSGWQRETQADDTDADQETARFLPSFSPWCWATWRRTWETLLEPGWDYECSKGSHPLQHGYDWELQRITEREGAVLVPDASRSQNIGQEGGLTADSGDWEWTQSHSFREARGPVSYRLEGTSA